MLLQKYAPDALETTLKNNGYQIVEHLSPDQIQETYFKNRTDNLKAYENVYFIEAKFENA
ncbi:MAG: hypothetical protein QM644_03470 [Mobilitalea sp.]